MSEYTTYIHKVPELSDELRLQIVSLYLKYYNGSNQAQVLDDLSKKNEILILYYGNLVVGFSSLQVYDYRWCEQMIRIIYSGDTIVDRAHWGQQALAFRWIERAGEIKQEDPDKRLFWFVIVKGHRTYRYLPTFAKSFFPHWSIERDDLKQLADDLAFDKFGDLYNSDTGTLEFHQSRGHLKTDIAYPSEEEMNKESVQFFIKKNPNYLQGHELVCLCELDENNMKPLTKRIFKKAYHERVMAEAL